MFTPGTEHVLARLDHIQALVDELVRAKDDLVERQDLAERIRRELLAAKASLKLDNPFES